MMDLGTKLARDMERWVVAALALLALVFLANACIPIFRGTPSGDPRIPLHPRVAPLGEGRAHRAPADTTTEDSW